MKTEARHTHMDQRRQHIQPNSRRERDDDIPEDRVREQVLERDPPALVRLDLLDADHGEVERRELCTRAQVTVR